MASSRRCAHCNAELPPVSRRWSPGTRRQARSLRRDAIYCSDLCKLRASRQRAAHSGSAAQPLPGPSALTLQAVSAPASPGGAELPAPPPALRCPRCQTPVPVAVGTGAGARLSCPGCKKELVLKPKEGREDG